MDGATPPVPFSSSRGRLAPAAHPTLERMGVLVIVLLLSLIGASSTSDVRHPPLWHWIEETPAIRSGLLSGESHYRQQSQTRKVSFVDAFSSIGDPRTFDRLDASLSKHGTAFEAGPAGPERFWVAYDPAHRLLRYHHGCCSYSEEILMANVGPPPSAVARYDLSKVVTQRGLQIGDSPAEAERVFGKAKSTVAGRDGYSGFFYSHTILRTCVQDSTLVFLRNRLVAISLWNGC